MVFDISGVKSFHIRGEARHPECLTGDGDNDVMIYVMDPDYKWLDE